MQQCTVSPGEDDGALMAELFGEVDDLAIVGEEFDLGTDQEIHRFEDATGASSALDEEGTHKFRQGPITMFGKTARVRNPNMRFQPLLGITTFPIPID